MTDDAATYLVKWTVEHIGDEPYVGTVEPEDRPARYAEQCLHDAEAAGPTAGQLGAAASDLHGAPSLAAFMTREIDLAAQRRHHRSIRRPV